MAAVYHLKIKYDQDKFAAVFLEAKRPVSFRLEDKHVVNEHRVVRRSQKCPHVVHFNVPHDWFEANSRHQKRYSEGSEEIRGCRGLLGRVILCMKTSLKVIPLK